MILGEIIGMDMVVVLAVVALLFGGAKLPKLARSLGSAKGEFERGLKDGAPTTDTAASTTPAPADPAVPEAAADPAPSPTTALADAPSPAADPAAIAAAEAAAAAARAEAEALKARAAATRPRTDTTAG